MYFLESSDEPSDNVLFVNFNQNCTSLAVGSKKGFKLYSFNLADNLEITHENTAEDIRIVERLFSSNLVAIVTISEPRKLKVCLFKEIKGWSEICDYSYPNSILAVKLNRSRLVVCLEKTLYIHNIFDMKVVHTIRYTSPNPRGLCVLSANIDKLPSCYLAYPSSSATGKVQIFDANNLEAKSMIPAHDNPLAAMTFAPEGTKLATASRKGTVIRIFNVLDGTKLFEFRQEIDRCVKIYSLSFSVDSAFLSASTNTETVHIFKLDECTDVNSSKDSHLNWIGHFSKALMQSASNLSSQKPYMFRPDHPFATVHLPFSGVHNICAITSIQKIARVLVVSPDGVLYIHNLDPVKGGDCTLVYTHNLIDSNQESGICEIIDSNVPESISPLSQLQDPNARGHTQTDPTACPPAISTDD